MTIVHRLLPSAFFHSLQLRLSGALIVLALVTAAVAGIAAFYRSYYASYEVQDETLRQIAAYISPTAVVPHHAGGGDDDGGAEMVDGEVHGCAAREGRRVPTGAGRSHVVPIARR